MYRPTRLLAAIVLAAACGGPKVGSIGAVLSRDADTRSVHVRDVPPGLAAEKAGLLPGDEILMIDGVYVRDLPSQDLRARLRGDVGTAVELTVVRGAEVMRLRVTRSELRERDEVPPKEERIDP